ncbi:mannosyltransferase [Fulvivirga sp. M361]|uniref:polyprenol phosphomannose-dependent alpha 1,6 mannosyltransferase MptB n=1 Tax=Fulvivirga sp. M361 TaxID=2594266 RepID=UPI00117BBE25|nr:polyprenol phosphomannose-dependent alpha 1,6 mannosyltransferase MptB [Fulvivirga sp. M361]TRX55549.1 mannosyltransferase [Fulvivirga sp. M361]
MDDKRSINVFYGASFLSAFLYIGIVYFINRHDSVTLLTAYGTLFLCYFFLLNKSANVNIKAAIGAGVVFRLVLFFSFPNLSDDIYRFVWDGKLINAGIHPFSYLPRQLVEAGDLPGSLTLELFNQLNSPDYFTIYPPVAQFVFWLSTVVSDTVLGSAIFIRSCIFTAELGTLWLLIKLCNIYQTKSHNALIYALNPLVILELTGNLHFEAFMIFFILLSLYLYKKQKIAGVATGLALAIAAKLLPLMFLPSFFRRMSFKKLIFLYLLVAIGAVLLFLPLVDFSLFKGMGSSIALYFQKFEFNASIYYLVREVGFWVKGYNIIGVAGKWLSVITFLLIIMISLVPKPEKIRLPLVFLWILFIYLVMATTVHPWYITTLLALSVLTNLRFPMIWSGLIFLTYIGYTETTYVESMFVVLIEYFIVFIFIGYELFYSFKGVKKPMVFH